MEDIIHRIVTTGGYLPEESIRKLVLGGTCSGWENGELKLKLIYGILKFIFTFFLLILYLFPNLCSCLMLIFSLKSMETTGQTYCFMYMNMSINVFILHACKIEKPEFL